MPESWRSLELWINLKSLFIRVHINLKEEEKRGNQSETKGTTELQINVSLASQQECLKT